MPIKRDLEKRWVAWVKEFGEVYDYFGATKEEALTKAKAGTMSPRWPNIQVADLIKHMED